MKLTLWYQNYENWYLSFLRKICSANVESWSWSLCKFPWRNGTKRKEPGDLGKCTPGTKTLKLIPHVILGPVKIILKTTSWYLISKELEISPSPTTLNRIGTLVLLLIQEELFSECDVDLDLDLSAKDHLQCVPWRNGTKKKNQVTWESVHLVLKLLNWYSRDPWPSKNNTSKRLRGI